MKITKSQLKQIIKEELEKYAPPDPMVEIFAAPPPARKFDQLFVEGAPGDVFAEQVAEWLFAKDGGGETWRVQGQEFDELKRFIHIGLENWHKSR